MSLRRPDSSNTWLLLPHPGTSGNSFYQWLCPHPPPTSPSEDRAPLPLSPDTSTPTPILPLPRKLLFYLQNPLLVLATVTLYPLLCPIVCHPVSPHLGIQEHPGCPTHFWKLSITCTSSHYLEKEQYPVSLSCPGQNVLECIGGREVREKPTFFWVPSFFSCEGFSPAGAPTHKDPSASASGA